MWAKMLLLLLAKAQQASYLSSLRDSIRVQSVVRIVRLFYYLLLVTLAHLRALGAWCAPQDSCMAAVPHRERVVSEDLWWWHLATMRHPLTIAGAQPVCDCGHQRRKARASHQGCVRRRGPAMRSRVRVAGRHDPGRQVANPRTTLAIDGRTPRLEA